MLSGRAKAFLSLRCIAARNYFSIRKGDQFRVLRYSLAESS